MADNTLLEKVLSLQDKYQSLQDQLSSPDVMSDMKKFVQLPLNITASPRVSLRFTLGYALLRLQRDNYRHELQN